MNLVAIQILDILSQKYELQGVFPTCLRNAIKMPLKA